ncbi:MAG: SPASM domain-containing protein [Alphaproteobacteria bacterium]|nr:SPASM domain-containing protein [Alphaproteobacteria bacterium]MDE2013557.1 SPASM domain-containing protein [Alphaproteobacteria bacterium]
MRGIEVLKRSDVEFNTLTTVHRKNAHHGSEVYRFLKEIGSRYMQFMPIVERISTGVGADELKLVSPSSEARARVSDWSVEPMQFGRFLCTIFDEWVRNDVGRIFVQIFDVSLEMWYGQQSSICVFRPTCGTAMAIEHNGDLYSCDHFVYPENRLGNIMDVAIGEMATSPQQQEFGRAKQEALPRYCRECEVRFACNGECPKHRFLETPDGEPGLNYLCAAYKKFFNHIDPYMRFMANELRCDRAPANVMEFVRAQDVSEQRGNVGRNDPCVCGSGLKFKRCCGKL